MSVPARGPRLAAGGLALAATGLGWTGLTRTGLGSRPGAAARWSRHNYRDREVSLLLGPVVTAGACLGALTDPAGSDGAVAAAAAGVLGLYDDLFGNSHARGLRGHGAALRAGRATTGLVKAVGLAGIGGVAAWRAGSRRGQLVADTALIAGAANLVNLVDLRPARAAKFVVITAAAAAGLTGPAAAAAAGAAMAGAPVELAERAMVGDCGAASLGTLLGWSLTRNASARQRWLFAAAVVGLTAASERVSFSAVIDASPVLRRLDRWGRTA